jgi:hypothetical protein
VSLVAEGRAITRSDAGVTASGQQISQMAPSTLLSKLRNNGRRSSSSPTLPHDNTSLSPLQTPAGPAQGLRVGEPSSPATNNNPAPGFRVPSFTESPTDESPVPQMTALPTYSDEWQQHRSASTPWERTGLTANGTIISVASRAHNFVFSLQPPKKFAPSLTPDEQPIPPPNTSSAQFYGHRPNSKNVSTSSLSVAEDAVSHKSASSRLVKGKLNLLNPLSLLARRRSSQNPPPKAEEANLRLNTLNLPSPRDDYDPRIRGNIVHDFSVPKGRRLNSFNGTSSAETSPSLDSRPSTQSTHRASENLPPLGSMAGRTSQSPAQSPLFREHFDDDGTSLQPQCTRCPHDLASSQAVQYHGDLLRLPTFAKSLPLDIFGEDDYRERAVMLGARGVSTPESTAEATSKSSPMLSPPSGSLQLPDMSSDTVPPPDKQHSPPLDFLRPIDSLPKHMTSTSSRFSFQLSGVGSEAQERLLEERHKQHVACQLSKADVKEHLGPDSEESDSTDTDLGDDDGLEEKIPGVNADFDDTGDHLQQQCLDLFYFTPVSAELSASNIPGLQPTPRGGDGQMAAIANIDPPLEPGFTPPILELDQKAFRQLPWFRGPGITSLDNQTAPAWSGILQKLSPQPEHPQEDVDDMYFDDGNIESLDGMADDASFDEDLFDDETDKIQDISARNARNLELAARQHPVQLSEAASLAQRTDQVCTHEHASENSASVSTGPNTSENAMSGEDRRGEADVSSKGQGNGLTEDNLAYQNALVSAANQAAAQGRFSRHLSMSQYSENLNSRSQVAESQPGLISDDSRVSVFLSNGRAKDEPSDFTFDDSLEDDPMIAEANAEVLENDDDGFYGQEFGFYARSYGKANSEMINGGYFGPGGGEGVHRSHSAKANFQEPSLTPITERSEWSHRNSVASLHTLGMPHSVQSITSPGIAQLLDLDPSSFEDEMSLSALMKLRRGAWGGSQTSLNSSGGSQAGSSPLAQLPLSDSFVSQSADLESGPPSGNEFPRRSYDSTVLLPHVFEEERTLQSSNATETQTTPPEKLSDAGPPPAPPPPAVPDLSAQSESLSQTPHALEKAAKGHSRASSSAESVSYVKDPQGSGRWLLERRRTRDDGELELIGREYVAGARI